jgi:hypothetical protein
VLGRGGMAAAAAAAGAEGKKRERGELLIGGRS